jgi:hypothetical protein
MLPWQATFPHERHRLLNRALPGTTSAYVSPCALQMVPPEADWVLLEFTFNDAERAAADQSPDDPTRHAPSLHFPIDCDACSCLPLGL